MNKFIELPTKSELMKTTLDVFSQCDNELLSVEEINSLVAEKLNLSNVQLSIESYSSNGTEFEYRMRCARTELKYSNKLINPKRGFWKLVV